MRSEPRISFPATFAGDECEMVAHEAQSCLWWARLDLRQKLMCPRIEVFAVDHIVFDAICAGDFLSCRFESVVEVWQVYRLIVSTVCCNFDIDSRSMSGRLCAKPALPVSRILSSCFDPASRAPTSAPWSIGGAVQATAIVA